MVGFFLGLLWFRCRVWVCIHDMAERLMRGSIVWFASVVSHYGYFGELKVEEYVVLVWVLGGGA